MDPLQAAEAVQAKVTGSPVASVQLQQSLVRPSPHAELC